MGWRTLKAISLAFAALLLWAFAARADAPSRTLVLRIPFESGAMATAVLPDGNTAELGRVRALPVKTNWPAYTASKWGTPGTVCASAVNAIHLLTGIEKGRGRIVSIVPTVTVAPAAPKGAFFSVEAPAGTGLFGAFAPLTGSKFFIEGRDGRKRPIALSADRSSDKSSDREKALAIETGETLVIESDLPARPEVWMVEIENRPGGRVLAWTRRGFEVVARVVRPVGGVGRFGGTEFQSVGRIRASHTGVIDIATSPLGQVGGIQIMPLRHALTSAEMAGAWQATQWMIVAPPPGEGPLEGTPPLFKGTLMPGTRTGAEKLSDLWSTYGRRPLVLGRFDGGSWQRLPAVAGKADNALRSLTHLRLYYPFWDAPQSE